MSNVLARTYIDDDVVTVVPQDSLTKGERTREGRQITASAPDEPKTIDGYRDDYWETHRIAEDVDGSDFSESENLSKAELARRVGVKPSVVSRLFNGEGKNVQLDTLTDVADALGVYFDVGIRRQPKRTTSRHAPIEVEVAA